MPKRPKKAQKILTKANHQAKSFLYRYFFSTLYLLGVASIIPIVVINAAPTEIGFWSATPAVMSLFAVGLAIMGAVGVIRASDTSKQGYQYLSLSTLFPGFIAVGVSLGLDSMIRNIVVQYVPEYNLIDPILKIYLSTAVPHVWALIGGYIVVGFVWWGLSRVD